METLRSLIPRRGLVPAVLAGLLALAAVAGFWGTRHALGRAADRGVAGAAGAGASAIAQRLRADGAVLEAAAEGLAGAADHPPGVAERTLDRLASDLPGRPLALAAAAGDTVRVTAVTPGDGASALRGLDLTTLPDWRVSLALATDSGAPRAQTADLRGAGPTVLVALPLYGSAAAPTEIGSRRALLQGYVVTTETPRSLEGAGLAGLGPGLAARVLEETTALVTSGAPALAPVPASAASATTLVDGVPWTVTAWSTSGADAVPWWILAGGLALAVVVGAASALADHRSTRLAELATARADEVALVARTGPLLQQSLELGDLLPAFVVELADELALEEVAISLVSPTGVLAPAFSFGSGSVGAPVDPGQLPPVPTRVARDGRLALPLQHGGRLVGTLAARAREGLEPLQLQALMAVTDLLAAAVGNVRLFRQEQEMVVRLRDLDRMKMTFLGSVSHELRTSVTAIVGFADLLGAQPGALGAQQQADFLDRIKRNAHSLAVLIDDMLDFARLERSVMSVSLRPVDLSELVPKVITQMSSILQHHAVLDKLAPGVVVSADPSAVERILVNLLSNAAKYTPAGTEVTVSLVQEGDSAVLAVADRGPGIPSEEQDRVFDMFYRVDNPVTRAARGVGIGLALARQLVVLLHGQITVDESPGGGARFRVLLPLAEDAPVAVSADVGAGVSPA